MDCKFTWEAQDLSTLPEIEFPLEGQDLSAIPEIEFVHAAEWGPEISTNIVRISSTAVLKFGYEVLPQEALNMEYVFDHSDNQIRVPCVYRSFVSNNICYIAMEFIDGDRLDEMPWSKRPAQERQSIILQLTKGLLHLRSLRSCQPGPVGQGIPMGGIFSIYGANQTFQTAADMEPWFNHKLGLIGAGDVTGMFKDLVMCHMDISPENLVLDKDGRLWILNWKWAGFFPQEFEKASLLHRPLGDTEFQFFRDVWHELGNSGCDERLLNLLTSVYQVNDGAFQGSHLICL